MIDVNATNTKGFTPLDVLLESPSDHGDLALGELIWAAGGRTAAEVDPPIPPPGAPTPTSLTSATPRRPRRTVEEDHDNYQNTPGTLMVVATLIATITFQAGMNPPGGFMQANVAVAGQRRRRDIGQPSKGEALPFAGQAVLGDKLTWFLIFDVVGLFASLSIILLLICAVPSRKKMVMGVLVWVMWVAVFCTALAFQTAIVLIYEEDDMVIGVLANAWFGLLRVTVVWISIRFIVHLLRWAGWMKRKGGQQPESNRARRGLLLVIRRMVATVLIVIVAAAACYVNLKLQTWIN